MSVVALSVAYAWIAALQVVIGVSCLALGLKRRGQFGAGQAPIGTMFLLSAALKILSDIVPHEILLPLMVASFGACSAWFVRTARADAVRRHELKQRHPSL
jgi:hypothetical protein